MIRDELEFILKYRHLPKTSYECRTICTYNKPQQYKIKIEAKRESWREGRTDT